MEPTVTLLGLVSANTAAATCLAVNLGGEVPGQVALGLDMPATAAMAGGSGRGSGGLWLGCGGGPRVGKVLCRCCKRWAGSWLPGGQAVRGLTWDDERADILGH